MQISRKLIYVHGNRNHNWPECSSRPLYPPFYGLVIETKKRNHRRIDCVTSWSMISLLLFLYYSLCLFSSLSPSHCSCKAINAAAVITSAGLLLLWSSCIFPFCRWGFLAWISCFHFYVLDSVCLSTTKKIAFYLLILDLWKDNLHSSRKVIKWREIFGYLFSLNFSSLSLSTLLKCFFNKNKLLLLEDNYKNSSIV